MRIKKDKDGLYSMQCRVDETLYNRILSVLKEKEWIQNTTVKNLIKAGLEKFEAAK